MKVLININGQERIGDIIQNGDHQDVYLDGIIIGHITTTQTPKPKTAKPQKDKPNRGPIPRSKKWLQ